MRPRKRIESVEDRRHDRDHDHQRQQLDSAQVKLVWMAAQEFLHTFAQRKPDPGARPELFRAFADQVIADM